MNKVSRKFYGLLVLAALVGMLLPMGGLVHAESKGSGRTNTVASADYATMHEIVGRLVNASSAEKARTIFASLPEDIQQTILKAISSAKPTLHVVEEVNQPPAPTSPTGHGHINYYVQNEIWGHLFWRYNQEIEWYYNGSTITSIPIHRRYPSNVAAFVNYSPGDQNSTGGQGQNYYQLETQGHFTFCLSWACGQNNAWLREYVDRQGRHGVAGGF